MFSSKKFITVFYSLPFDSVLQSATTFCGGNRMCFAHTVGTQEVGRWIPQLLQLEARLYYFSYFRFSISRFFNLSYTYYPCFSYDGRLDNSCVVPVTYRP